MTSKITKDLADVCKAFVSSYAPGTDATLDITYCDAKDALAAFEHQQARNKESITEALLISDGWEQRANNPRQFSKPISQADITHLCLYRAPDGYWFHVDTHADLVDLRIVTTMGEVCDLVEAITVTK